MKKSIILIACTVITIFILNLCIKLPIVNSGLSREFKDTSVAGQALWFLEEDSYAKENMVNILLLGLDRRSPEEASRTDSMILLTIDKKNKRVKATSLMRDMYVPIPGNPSNKINSAYTRGGALLSIETVNKNFGLKIRDFVEADFTGFEKIIDKLGGVKIDVKPKEAEHCFVEKPGPQVLNGKQTLAYSRIRKVGNADFERTERQRRVLNEIYRKIRGGDSNKITGIIKELLPNVKTSLNLKEMTNIVSEVSKYNIEKLDELRIPVSGGFSDEKINGQSCLVPDMEENCKILREFIYGEKK